MVRTALMILALVVGTAAAQACAEARLPGDQGAMPMEALRREPITLELDVPYAATGNPRQRLDLYLPKKPASDRLPVIVFFHGGGWRWGDKRDGAGQLLPFVRGGAYAGVSAGYRLSAEVRWPAQIHDAKAAIRWVRAQADRYGFDPGRIAVFGRSAGAHLALMLGLSGAVPELEGDLGPHAGTSSRVCAAVNFFGITDMLAMIGQPGDIDRARPDAPEALLIGGALPDNTVRALAASPIRYVSSDDPPVLTLHGTADRIVPYDQAVRLDKALSDAGVPSFLITVAGAGHGGFPDGAFERVNDFFSRFLHDEDIRIPTETLHAP